MAIVNNGTKNNLNTSQIPSGYTKPNITTFLDYEYKRSFTLAVLKTTVENASKSVTMTNIIDNAAIGITKQIDDILAGDFLATANVEAFSVFRILSNNFIDTSGDGDVLSNVGMNYIAEVDLYIKTS